VSGGGFLRGPGRSYAPGGAGQSRADDVPERPQRPDEEQARRELMRANELLSEAKHLKDLPAAGWTERRDQLAAQIEEFAGRLRTSAGAQPSENADRDRAATVAAVATARKLVERARPPRAEPLVAGETEIEPRIADKSISPDELIHWVAGLSARERSAIWRRMGAAHSNRDDSFGVALANYVAAHRDRSPPLGRDLQALATMDARSFAQWRELSGRGPQLGQSSIEPAGPTQSRPLDPAGQSFADPARDQDGDGRADALGGLRDATPPAFEQSQADVAATRAGVEQAVAALDVVRDQVLPAYDDAVTALSAAGAYQLQARAIFVFRQAVTFRAELRAMGNTETSAQLERAIDRAGVELGRRLTGRELHGRPVLAGVPGLDLSRGKDPAALLAADAAIAVTLIDAAQQIVERLSPASTDQTSAASDEDPRAAQEAAALVHSFRTRPLSLAYLRALLVERGLWDQLERAPLRYGNGLPMGRTLADVGRAAETQAAEFGAAVDLGAFDLAAAEALLRANVADAEADAIDNPEEQTDPNHGKRTKRSRQVAAMLAAADPTALRAILEALDRRGLLEDFVRYLPPNEVARLHARLPIGGRGGIKADLREHFEGRDTANRSVSHYLGKLPGGGVLTFAGNVATGGFLSDHDEQYAAMKRGDLTEGEYKSATNHAATKALTTVAVAGVAGGAGGAYVEGMTAGLAARSTAGRYVSRALVGAAEGFAGGIGAQAGADLVDQEFSGFGAYGKAGALGAGLGAGISVVAGVGAEGARFLPAGVQTVAQKLYAMFPHHAELFDGLRAAGARHGATIRIKVSRRSRWRRSTAAHG
jgi:hypothetical protein